LTPDNAEIVHLILKAYKASIQSTLSPHQQSSQSIVPWGSLFFTVINAQLPASHPALPGAPDDWEKSEWWKAKKWAYHTLNRLFQRYGNPSQLSGTLKKEIKGFADHFVTSFAPEIFKTYLVQVEKFVKKESWLSQKCLAAIINYFTSW
jgi:importin-7